MPSQNLSPELHLLDLFSHAKTFNCLKDDVGRLLSESHSCLFEKFSLLNKIGEESAWSRLSWLFFSANIRLVEQSLEFLSVFSKRLKLLISEAVCGVLSLLDILRVVLEELVAVAIVSEDHVLENLHQMIIGSAVALLDCLELRLHDL